MRLTYIFHSGFVLETEKSILIFDYWMDPGNVMESVLQSEKPLYPKIRNYHPIHD
jgi:L-ascorbate metabolism protein UlaG (beta-lactamase superfamily)